MKTFRYVYKNRQYDQHNRKKEPKTDPGPCGNLDVMAMAVQVSEKTLERLGYLAFPTGKKKIPTSHHTQNKFQLY